MLPGPNATLKPFRAPKKPPHTMFLDEVLDFILSITQVIRNLNYIIHNAVLVCGACHFALKFTCKMHEIEFHCD
jgi:hypothetical protein